MSGKRTRLNWANFDKGEAESAGNWLTFSSLAMENKTHVCSTIWGGNIMYVEMDRVFTISSFQPSQTSLFWYGIFSSLHVLLGVKGYKTLMNAFTSMFCLLDDSILSLWKTEL